MSQLSSVKDLTSMEQITSLVNEGIASLGYTCTALYKAQVDPYTDMCSNFKQIRKHVEHADQCLKKSEVKLKVQLKSLDESIEQLITERKDVEQKKKEKERAIEELHTRKSSTENLLRMSKMALRQAEENEDLAVRKKEKMQELKTDGSLMVATGAILTAIPIIGWIAGPMIICDGAQALKDATNAINDAVREKAECQSSMMRHSQQISVYNSQISETQIQILKAKTMLNNIQGNIKRLQHRQVAIVDIQGSYKTAVHTISILSGRFNVLESQTRSSIYWTPVINLMKEAGNALKTIANNQLLYNHNVPGLINTMSENMRRLESLTLINASNNSIYVAYY